jgi:hypothetical protein
MKMVIEIDAETGEITAKKENGGITEELQPVKFSTRSMSSHETKNHVDDINKFHPHEGHKLDGRNVVEVKGHALIRTSSSPGCIYYVFGTPPNQYCYWVCS